MNKFYVYEHWRPDKNEPFYVGKGSGSRAWKIGRAKNPYYANVVAKLAAIGLCVEVRLVVGEMTAEQAYDAEINRIAFWQAKGVKLTNQTAGGEGMLNPSDELRARFAEISRSRPRTPEFCAKMSKAASNQSAETRAKRSASMTGIVRSEKTKLKVSRSKSDPPAETRERNRLAAKLSWEDPEWRANQVAARLGVIRITDGVENKTVRLVGEEIPTGWRRGMTKRRALVAHNGEAT
jgi:hypothetical protein